MSGIVTASVPTMMTLPFICALENRSTSSEIPAVWNIPTFPKSGTLKRGSHGRVCILEAETVFKQMYEKSLKMHTI